MIMEIQTSLHRTVVKAPVMMMMMMMVTAAGAVSVELSVAFCRPTLRHSYTAMQQPPPANNIGSTAGCRRIPEHRDNN